MESYFHPRIKENSMNKRIKVFGLVHGVGFRYYISRKAMELSISGYVRNCKDGTVEIIAQGEDKEVEELIEYSRIGPRFSDVSDVEVSDIVNEVEFPSFKILDF